MAGRGASCTGPPSEASVSSAARRVQTRITGDRGVAAELAALGIRVLEVLPGPIATDMLAGSERTPEACAFPEYRPLAEALHAGRTALGGADAAGAETRMSAFVAGLVGRPKG